MTQPSSTSTTPDSPSPSSLDWPFWGPYLSRISRLAAAPLVHTASENEPTKTAPSENDSLAATLRTLTIHRDNRGNVRETFRSSWFPMVPPIKQLVRSKSKAKTLRGMHRHLVQWDVWHIVRGAALVRTYDHETGRNTFTWAGPGHTIAIPPGLSHGFYTPDGCILLYGLTEEYTGDDEFGWYFADGLISAIPPEFQEDWPTRYSGLNISERDLHAPNLSDIDG